jgi:hypothetical protein
VRKPTKSFVSPASGRSDVSFPLKCTGVGMKELCQPCQLPRFRLRPGQTHLRAVQLFLPPQARTPPSLVHQRPHPSIQLSKPPRSLKPRRRPAISASQTSSITSQLTLLPLLVTSLPAQIRPLVYSAFNTVAPWNRSLLRSEPPWSLPVQLVKSLLSRRSPRPSLSPPSMSYLAFPRHLTHGP